MDEAVLRIVVKDEGGVDSSLPSEEGPSYRSNPPPPYQAAPPPVQNNIPPPTPRSPAERPAASASQPFNPQAEAQRMFDAEVRREQIKQVYERMYGSAQDTKNAFDATLDLALKMRGTLGGIFGTVAGATLDVISAVRAFKKPEQSRAAQMAERLNAEWQDAPHKADGGEVQHYRKGTVEVKGEAGPDQVPSMLTAGEGVVTEQAMDVPENKAAVAEMNAGRKLDADFYRQFKEGGFINQSKAADEAIKIIEDAFNSGMKVIAVLKDKEMELTRVSAGKYRDPNGNSVGSTFPMTGVGHFEMRPPKSSAPEKQDTLRLSGEEMYSMKRAENIFNDLLDYNVGGAFGIEVNPHFAALKKPFNQGKINSASDVYDLLKHHKQPEAESIKQYGSSHKDKDDLSLVTDIPENKTAVAEMNAGRIPAEQQEIFATAKEALIAVGQTQKEAEQVLQKVLQAADKVFATAQEVITAAYKTPETAKREESQRKEEIKPPEPYGPSRQDRPEAENVAEDLYNAQQEEFDAEARSAPDRSMEERRKKKESEDYTRSLPEAKEVSKLNPAELPEASAAPAESGIDMAAIGEAAEGPLAIVGAVLEAIKVLREAAVGAAQELGDFAVAVANPDANPATMFKEIGSGIKDQTGGWINAGNLIGIFGPAVGEATTQVGRFMDAVKGAADRYAEYSPQISQAQALAEIQQTMGDLRRAQEGGPELARYIQMQSNMQQKFEDIKIKLLTNILKIMTPLMSILEKLMPAGDTIGAAIDQVAAPLVLLATIAGEIAGLQRDALTPDIMDPTSLITNVATGTAGPGLTLPPNT